jgi:hypothetical protein
MALFAILAVVASQVIAGTPPIKGRMVSRFPDRLPNWKKST